MARREGICDVNLNGNNFQRLKSGHICELRDNGRWRRN
jgi:hypothetical protein